MKDADIPVGHKHNICSEHFSDWVSSLKNSDERKSGQLDRVFRNHERPR